MTDENSFAGRFCFGFVLVAANGFGIFRMQSIAVCPMGDECEFDVLLTP